VERRRTVEPFVITRLLFESLWMLAAALAAVQFTLIAIWSWLRSRTAARAVCIGFAAIPTLLILSAVVVTSRERIIMVCHDLAKAVEADDVSAIRRHLSADFEADGLERSAFVEHVEGVLARFSVHYPELKRFKVTFPDKGVGIATFNVSCRVESAEMSYGWLPSRWRLTFGRFGDAWLVTNIKPIPIPPLHIHHLKDVPR